MIFYIRFNKVRNVLEYRWGRDGDWWILGARQLQHALRSRQREKITVKFIQYRKGKYE